MLGGLYHIMEVNMNKFLEKYKEERDSGTVDFILDSNGTIDDLNIVHDYFMQDMLEETAREFENYRKYIETSFQRNMRLSGHRESDFR